jgi:hypothetical protein
MNADKSILVPNRPPMGSVRHLRGARLLWRAILNPAGLETGLRIWRSAPLAMLAAGNARNSVSR